MTEAELNDAIRRTNEALGLVYTAFAATVRERGRYKQHFPMMAGQSAEMILRLRREIDDLIGLTDFVAEFGVPPTDTELDAMGPPDPDANGAAAPQQQPAAK